MKSPVVLAIVGAAVCCPLIAQDAMQYGLKFQNVVAENDKVRVVHYTPQPGDKTPVHSHPNYVVYVVKGGKVKYTLPDGTTTVSDLKTGAVYLKGPVTHSDEALDAVETIIVELKQ